MSRKPMSDEQKQKARERMQKMWAERKAGQSTAQDSEGASTNSVQGQTLLAEALQHAQQALEVLISIRDENPDMIEASQSVEALKESIARMGQVEGLLRLQK